jgi:hypothetical protein
MLEQNMTPAALERAKAILGGASLGKLQAGLTNTDAITVRLDPGNTSTFRSQIRESTWRENVPTAIA